MNLNFNELLAIVQLIKIRKSSDGNKIKPQAIRRLEGSIKKIKVFLSSTPESSAHN